jgi:trehalose/maltose hydrolase-like predicted phosphorylase
MYGLNKRKNFCEFEYEMENEPVLATLFTTGNGYMGIRGSFEEFGSLRIQGAFVRGFIDEITEIIEPFCENEYIKKFYIDEQRLKDFEKQESCVNMPDFLLIKIIIGNKIFYPWEGKILEWERELDSSKAIYLRKVIWQDEDGNKTKFEFERFASFNNEHLYCQRLKIVPLNHSKSISVISGIDTLVKTSGQKITTSEKKSINGSEIYYQFSAINKYNFNALYKIKHNNSKGKISKYDNEGITGIKIDFLTDKEYIIEKLTYIVTSRDTNEPIENFAKNNMEKIENYNSEKTKHIKEYEKYFYAMDIIIEGDDDSDGYLRFASYHTAISASRNDYVHGISAKGLTGERYNQFVWWDSEIYQLPYFIFTAPKTAKLLLMYRYKLLEQSKLNAESEDMKGAKFAFCSSVKGDERVWKYCRHPFMQVHINSDIPYGIINYYYSTGDSDFLKEFGLKIIYECLLYWTSRITKINNRYEILQVTGTDEHHPYVDNDAYTNYCVKYIFNNFLQLYKEFNFNLDKEEEKLFIDIKENIYLPIEANGLIPQFDGYFNLSRNLEVKGNGSLKQFQMKSSGLYHKSQIIKQPDVVLMYTYLNIPMNKEFYSVNWDYYEQMCEISSSLSFPAHAIASADNNRMLSFYNNFQKTLKIDVNDLHSVAWQGVHSGCLAGGYFSILRGYFGVKMFLNYVEINPVKIFLWKNVLAKFYYKGSLIELNLCEKFLTVKILEGNAINIKHRDKEILLKNNISFEI